MKKIIVPILSIAAFLFFLSHVQLFAQSSQKQPAAKQKVGKSKIVVEYLSFTKPTQQYDVYPWETLKVDDFRSAYTQMIGRKPLEEWVRSLTGTAANKNRMIMAFKEQFVLITSCKPHMCDESQIIVLYDPVKKKSFGVLAKDGKFEWLGEPSEKVTDLLKVLLVEEYKDIYKAGD